MSAPTLDDYRWLVSEAAEVWLARAAQDRERLVTVVKRLRGDLGTARTHLVLEQVELRRRARAKFVHAERMFFTPKSLEQATDERIAEYKAGRFDRYRERADLCCGIGGDLLALARAGNCCGAELDEVLGVLAEANCRAVGVGARVEVADVSQPTDQPVEAWHIDPDRRAGEGRTTYLDAYRPGPEVIERWLVRCPQAAVKLAPASAIPARWERDVEREWIGSRGECRQQVAWFGQFARHAGQRVATLVGPAGTASVIGTGDERAEVADAVGDYVYEPHAAVYAAGLACALAQTHDLKIIDRPSGYLTGERPVVPSLLATFRVVDVLPFDHKRTKAWLRERHVGQLEVKQRGIDLQPARLQQTLRASGDNSITMLLTPHRSAVHAILARRI